MKDSKNSNTSSTLKTIGLRFEISTLSSTWVCNLFYVNSTDSSSLIKIIASVKPNEIYNLAAQSHVKVSFDLSEYTTEVDAVGTLRLLEAIRILGLDNDVRFYQASTSELYGKVVETPQTEKTPFYPRSPYGKNINSFCDFSMMTLSTILFGKLVPNCTVTGS